MMPNYLTSREMEVLNALAKLGTWARPADVGGQQRSDHSRVLSNLVRKGYAEQRRRVVLPKNAGSVRGSSEYRCLYLHTPAQKVRRRK